MGVSWQKYTKRKMNAKYYKMRLKITPKHSLNQYIFNIKYVKYIELHKKITI